MSKGHRVMLKDAYADALREIARLRVVVEAARRRRQVEEDEELRWAILNERAKQPGGVTISTESGLFEVRRALNAALDRLSTGKPEA